MVVIGIWKSPALAKGINYQIAQLLYQLDGD
jgi:hypothetical protein